MKIPAVCLLLLFVSIAYATVSLDDVVKLSKANTSDDVILQLIQKEGLQRPVTSKDIVYLKQQGVSDRVIQYLMKISAKSEQVNTDKNLREYYATTKDGKQVKVVTNMDEYGNRMGGEVPPDPEPVQQKQQAYEAPPKEIRVVLENESLGADRYPDEYRDYPEYPEYVDDRYSMPEWPTYYPYGGGYYPYSPYYFPRHGRNGNFHQPGMIPDPNWRYDYSKKGPLIRQQKQHTQRQHTQRQQAPKSARAGVRRGK